MQGHIVKKPLANATLTVSTVSVALPDPPSGVVSGILTIEGADVRARWDGSTLSATTGSGMVMAKNSVWEIQGRDFFSAIRFISNEEATATVNVAYMSGG
jgi:hypothetical protein